LLNNCTIDHEYLTMIVCIRNRNNGRNVLFDVYGILLSDAVLQNRNPQTSTLSHDNT